MDYDFLIEPTHQSGPREGSVSAEKGHDILEVKVGGGAGRRRAAHIGGEHLSEGGHGDGHRTYQVGLIILG